MSDYIVQQGDTLSKIANQQLGNPYMWSQIARENNLRAPYPLYIGQRLLMRNLDQTPLRPTMGGLPIGGTRLTTGLYDTAGVSLPAQEQSASLMPARLYLFILVDEVLPSGKVVRKVLTVPQNFAEQIAANPEIFGIKPLNPSSSVSIGEHALGNTNSKFTSASSLPKGAPNMAGRPVYIDIAKAKAAGATIHSTEDIIKDLDKILQQNPAMESRINKLKDVIVNVEKEVLLEGDVPKSAIKSEAAMKTTRTLRFVQFVGVAFTVYDLGQATAKSIKTESADPIVAESIRQVGGWGGAWLGIKLGAAAGAAVGIETGPGAVVTGAVGALIFGTAGYFGADWIADWIDEN